MVAIRIGDKEFNEQELEVLAKAGVLNIGEKHDTSSATPNATPTHGPFPGNNNQFGIFSGSGVRPGMWNTTTRVRSIGQYIPMERTLFMNELIDVATGVTAGSGNNVTSACTVGPKPGQLKKAQITATFGIIHMSTKIFDVTQAGMRRNRADVDRNFFNMATVNNPWLPQVPGMMGDGIVNSTLRSEMFALAIELERNVGQVHFLGVAATEDNTYRGVARQWNGLDRLIRNDWTDANTGQTVASLNAAVVSFNTNVDGTDADGRSINVAMTDTLFGQMSFLDKLGVAPNFALVMRGDLFRQVSPVWACAFTTSRCTGTAGNPVQRNGDTIRLLDLNMQQNLYLPMEGFDIPVIIDDSIPRDTLGNNYYKSDIYGVALSGNGIPTLYGEYFDMGNGDAQEIVNQFGLASAETTVINNGMYRVFRRVTGGCIEYDFFARPRLITDAPFMHFRLDDVFYHTYYRETDPQPGFSYHRDGGMTYVS